MLNQIIEKRTTVNVDCVSWCSTSDLLAVAYELGHLTIHKVNWQHLWSLEAPRENVKILSMSWRPDGRALAVAYDINEIHIIEINQKEIVKKIEASITYIRWIEESFNNRYKEYQQSNDEYTPKQVPLPPTNDEIAIDEFRKVSHQKGMNFLIIGHSSGLLQFYIYGMFCCASLDVLKFYPGEEGQMCEILYCDIADDLKTIAVILSLNGKLKCLLLENNLLPERAQSLYNITYRRAIFETNLDYMERTMNYIVGAWDKILSNEMELKLAKCSSNDLSTDFLELLIRGFCPPYLHKFLTQDLNENRLQEASRTIESLHSIMHKLLLYPMQLAVENVINDLTLLQGMHKASCCDGKQFINVEENIIEECLVAAGGYCIKINEMLNIIDASMMKYKYFFHWLCTVMNKLNSGKKISHDDFTQQQRDAVRQYICEMDMNNKIAAMKSVVSLYLHDDGIFDVRSKGTQPWLNLLKENPTLENCLLIMPSTFQNMSLMQLHKYVKRCSVKIFENYEKFVDNFCLLNNWELSDSVFKLSAIKHCNDSRLLIAYTKPSENGMYANITKINNARSPIETISLYFNTEEYNQLYVNDLQFYTNDYLSVLLSVKNLSFYFHMPIFELSKRSYGKESIKNGFSMVSKMEDRLKIIENMKATRFIVNGIQNLIFIMTSDHRHLRIYSTDLSNDEKRFDLPYENTSKEVIAPDCSYGFQPVRNGKDPVAPTGEYSAKLSYFASLNYSPEEETINLNNIDMNGLRIS